MSTFFIQHKSSLVQYLIINMMIWNVVHLNVLTIFYLLNIRIIYVKNKNF